ncbi:MAG TPA: hypothetical protein VMY18_12300, partial [Acidobacteriota bacterium]|nr:hypothetical protein [Acidobacteriota bacterium]
DNASTSSKYKDGGTLIRSGRQLRFPITGDSLQDQAIKRFSRSMRAAVQAESTHRPSWRGFSADELCAHTWSNPFVYWNSKADLSSCG